MTETKRAFRHHCDECNAYRFLDWIRTRGGVANWPSVNLSNAGASWSTPANDKEGKPMTKPNWQSANQPSFIITDPEEIGVYIPEEVKRIKIAIRRASNNPFVTKLTDGSTRKVERALEKAGDDSFYKFDYSTQEAVILRPKDEISLAEWARQKEVPNG